MTNLRYIENTYNDRPKHTGMSIDNSGAKVLDDAFDVTFDKKTNQYVLDVYLADTSAYYEYQASMKNRPDIKPALLRSKHEGVTKPNLGGSNESDFYDVVGKHFSLDQGCERPAVHVRMQFDENGQLLEDQTEVGRVSFTNLLALSFDDVDKNTRYESIPTAIELAQKIDKVAQKHRLRTRQSKGAGDLIISSFSNVTNFALSKFALDNNIPMIFQNQSAILDWNNLSINTRQVAYNIIPNEFDEDIINDSGDGRSRKIKFASLYGHEREVEYSTKPHGNIIKGFHVLGRFTSPMQNLMETANLFNLTSFLNQRNENKKTFSPPFSVVKLKDIIRGIVPRMQADKLDYGFNKKNGRSYLSSKCSVDIPKVGASKIPSDFDLKRAIFDNPMKTEYDLKMAYNARGHIEASDDPTLAERILRIAVEEDGYYDALYFIHEEKNGQHAILPVLAEKLENGLIKKQTCREIQVTDDTSEFSAEAGMQSACKSILRGIIDNNLRPVEEAQITWANLEKRRRRQERLAAKEFATDAKELPKELHARYPAPEGTPSRAKKKGMKNTVLKRNSCNLVPIG